MHIYLRTNKKEMTMTKTTFNDYQLSEELLKSISLLNYNSPTKVQEQAIPAILDQKDIIIKSKTGSGKTAAFAIPICQLVDWNENKPQVLVITPTRELAVQVREDMFNIGRFERLKVSAIYGKAPFHIQQKELKQKTHMVVGTPGRIIDHLERETLDTSKVRYLVIDEADEMLRMGFIEEVDTIIRKLPVDRVTIVLSATMPKDIEDLCSRYMKKPEYIEVEEQTDSAEMISQERYEVGDMEKLDLLKDLMVVENPDSCIIFCNTKIKVDEVYNALSKLKLTCDRIHGGMEQPDRIRVMENFKKGLFRYMVATDVAARGIDIDNINHVINYDVPNTCESYVHRIGRTGRMGKTGKSMTFVAPSEVKLLESIHRFTGKEIPLMERPDKEQVAMARQEFVDKMNVMPEIKHSKAANISKDIMKLHINAGKKTKMRAVDIVGTFCSLEGVTAEDIGIINIMDTSTFVEVLNGKGAMALRELQKKEIKGRLRKVSRAER